MSVPARPLRADAAHNRARVLETAYETFAAEGLSVPIDEIARRAGVGAGTVYRHFPTKEDLFRAVVESRLRHIITEGRALLDRPGPDEALFSFLRSMVLDWGATDQGLVEALSGLGIDVDSVAPDAEDAFRGLLGELLAAAQRAGTVRADVDVPEIKALLVGCQAMQGYDNARAERVTGVVIDGLRPSR
ncbi:TetR/AcrR family transcriptional regulator [Mycobacterium sp.]|uniref:TetR/AcrR family transcriptional regulator n=1 Tax=Mycobacterium sp. TaxID=1785 RepID=UPI003BAF94F8